MDIGVGDLYVLQALRTNIICGALRKERTTAVAVKLCLGLR
jgi:hypothetical protein